MPMDIFLSVSGILLAAIGSAVAVLSLFRPRVADDRVARVFIAGAALVLMAGLFRRGIDGGRIPAFGLYEATTCYGVAVIAAYLAASVRNNVRGIAAFFAPPLTALLAIAFFHRTVRLDPGLATKGAWLGLHVTAAFLGYGFFTIASAIAAAYLVQDGNLRRKNFGPVFEGLPALEELDTMMHRQIEFGFPIFTAAIALGARLMWLTGGAAKWLADPKVVATLTMWTAYALLMHLRLRRGQHGRRFAVLIALGVACVLFAFLGVHAVSRSLHSFAFTAEVAAR